jgi:hypothetical protein
MDLTELVIFSAIGTLAGGSVKVNESDGLWLTR